jgi:membrane protease YdiL (CAAX protease family)
LSSPDNPQFPPQPPMASELPAPIPPDPFIHDPGVMQSLGTLPVPPGENPVWSGWDVLLIGGLTVLLALVVVPVIVVSGAQLLAYPHETWLEVSRKPVLALLSQLLAYSAIAAFMMVLVEGKYHVPFWKAINWNWPKNVVLMLTLGVFTVSLDVLSRYLPMPKTTPFDQFFVHPSDAYLTAAFAVTLGPLMEELFFRGFLYPALARRTGVTLAVLFTALPFGLIHYLQYQSWGSVLVIALVGVVLTVVRAATKSVAASFLVHVGYNGTLMALTALATDGFQHMEKAAVLRIQ